MGRRISGGGWDHCHQFCVVSVSIECPRKLGVKLETRIEVITATNNVFAEENKHTVTIFLLGEWSHGTPTVCTPSHHQCSSSLAGSHLSVEIPAFTLSCCPLFLSLHLQRITNPTQVMEPDKCEEWRWVSCSESLFPQPLFLPLQQLLNSGYVPPAAAK